MIDRRGASYFAERRRKIREEEIALVAPERRCSACGRVCARSRSLVLIRRRGVPVGAVCRSCYFKKANLK